MSVLTIVLEASLAVIGITVAIGALIVGSSVEGKVRRRDEIVAQQSTESRDEVRELVGV
ncbi:MAG TPA: hypothetical protein VIC81_06700 [Acidimicrobiales bacterium]|jgi:hypothetical protein